MQVTNIGLDKLSLLEIPLFSGLERMHLAKLVPALEEINYKDGQVIFQQGEFGDSLYIIVRGTAVVFINEGDEIRELARLGERECFGEMSLLTGDPRSAGVRAATDLTVLRLSKDRFDELLLEHNSLAVQFAAILARRLARIQSKPGGDKEPQTEKPVKREKEKEAITAEKKPPLPVPSKVIVKSKKLWLAFSGALALVLLFIYLGTTWLNYGQGHGDIVIGIAGSFSGQEGASFRNAVRMAVDEVNSGGGVLGVRVRADFKDDQGNINRGMANAQSFAEAEDVVAVIGHLEPYISAPASAVYERAGIIMLAPSGFVPPAARKEYKYVFRNMPGGEEYGGLAAEYIARQGLKRTVIYYGDSDHGRALANAFENRAGEQGVYIVDRQSDYLGPEKIESVLARWRIMGFDSIFLAEPLPEGAEFISQLRRSGIAAPVFACSYLDSPDLFPIGGQALEGITVFSVFNPLDRRPEVRGFVESYKKRFGVDPGMMAAQGYDSVKLLADAMRMIGSSDAGKVSGKLRELQKWPGVTGYYSFTQNGDVLGKDIVIKQVKNGNFTYPHH
ncbi:MAG: ABC transporter substrate-binding protein [Bacillota bacterium]